MTQTARNYAKALYELNVDAESIKTTEDILEEVFPYLGITTIAESEASEKTEGESIPETEYTDYDENYEETYDNPDGAYIDEDYDPDLDDWASGDAPE